MTIDNGIEVVCWRKRKRVLTSVHYRRVDSRKTLCGRHVHVTKVIQLNVRAATCSLCIKRIQLMRCEQWQEAARHEAAIKAIGLYPVAKPDTYMDTEKTAHEAPARQP